MVVDYGQRVETFQTLINPGIRTKPGARAVNGITDAMLANAPLPAVVWPRVIELIGGRPIVAHNASFDRGFVAHELRLLGLPPLKSQWICTMQRGQGLLGYRPRLSDLVQQVCGSSPRGWHRAMADVEALVEVAACWWPFIPVMPHQESAADILGDFR